MYTYIQRIRLERTFVLGCDLELGVSRQDDAQALEWTLRAAWNGLANAQFSAGTLCPHCASTTSMRKEKTAPTCKCWFVPSRLGRVLPWNTDKCSPSSAFKSRYFEGKGAAVDYNRSFFWYAHWLQCIRSFWNRLWNSPECFKSHLRRKLQARLRKEL